MVQKCLCCCSLKYGYYTYGIICLLYRISLISGLFYLPLYTNNRFAGQGFLVGWYFAAAAALFIALKGIAQNRSILMYPYIVVLILEIIGSFLTTIYMLVVTADEVWYYVAHLIIVGSIDVYSAICLSSLFTQTKQAEENPPRIYTAVPGKPLENQPVAWNYAQPV